MFTKITLQAHSNPKLAQKQDRLNALLQELEARPLPKPSVDVINDQIAKLNAEATSNPKLHKTVCNTQNRILKHLEKDLKIVPKHHYRNLWMAVGMSAFGIPMGVIFGFSFDNMAFLGIGLPIGMAIGLAVGQHLDTKAAQEHRQLNFQAQEI